MKKTNIDSQPFNTTQTTEIDNMSDEEVLKQFLLDIGCLDQLDEWTSKFNLFDVLKITRTEIRHSNLLAWLLTPNENHGLSDSILKGFIQSVISVYDRDEYVNISTLLMDFQSFILYRERYNIDLLAISDKEKFVLCIENKIDAGEHDNQLARYQKTIEEAFPGYKAVYIYLSPAGIEPSLPDTWISMSYSKVVEIIESACKKRKLAPDVELLINHYIETIRRDVVGDKRLTDICAEIYKRHKRALDLIYENKPDRTSDVSACFRKWGIQKKEEGEIEIILDKCSKTYTRFKTQTMSKLLPDASEALSGWNTPNYYFYELVNNGGTEFYIQLSLSSRNVPDELREICDVINIACSEMHTQSTSRKRKENWQWRIVKRTSTSKITPETTEEKIYELLNKKLEEIRKFENELLSKLNKEHYPT